MGRLKNIVIAVCLSALFSCGNQENRTTLSGYFQLRPLIEDQIKTFSKLRPRVLKKVSLDGQVDESQLQFDTTEWNREMEIFFTADIDRPSLVGAFEKSKDGPTSVYTRKNDQEDGVKVFEVSFHDNSQVPQEIRITSTTINSLYTSKRRFKLSFEEKDGSPMLLFYSVNGEQTILNRSTTTYQIEGKIIY